MINKKNELFCFEVRPNTKEPATPHGYKDAIQNFDIEGVLRQGYNVGLKLAPNLVAIDADFDEARGLNGLAELAQLEKELGELPATYVQRTPRGGKHLIFQVPSGFSPRGKIGKAIDIKFNGYVLLAGSQINGIFYTVENGESPDGLEIASLPNAWAKFLQSNMYYTAKEGTTMTDETHKKDCKLESCVKADKAKTEESIDYTKKEKILMTDETPKEDNGQLEAYIKADKAKTEQKIIEAIEALDEDRKAHILSCNFLMNAIMNRAYLSEPAWFSLITVLANSGYSDDFIHLISRDYPRYNVEETSRKIAAAHRFGRVHTCRFISSHGLCADCPLRVEVA